MKPKKLSDLRRDIEALEGRWALSPEHELTYKARATGHGTRATDNGTRRATGHGTRATGHGTRAQEAGLKASLIAAEPDALVVSVTAKEDASHTVTGLVKLAGKWELDEKNRITFSVKRPFGKYDKLTFQGAWKMNKNHEVVYGFTSRQAVEGRGKRRRRITKVTQELVFKGAWEILEKNCLTYLIGVDSDSAFRCRGTFETKSILAKQGEIRYQVGIEYTTTRGAGKCITQTLMFFGKWKFSDDLSLSFELKRADGKRSEIKVGADIDLKKHRGPGARRLLPDEISIDLTSREGDPLGVELVLTKNFFKGSAQTFVRLRRTLKETAAEAGITLPW